MGLDQLLCSKLPGKYRQALTLMAIFCVFVKQAKPVSVRTWRIPLSSRVYPLTVRSQSASPSSNSSEKPRLSMLMFFAARSASRFAMSCSIVYSAE